MKNQLLLLSLIFFDLNQNMQGSMTDEFVEAAQMVAGLPREAKIWWIRNVIGANKYLNDFLHKNLYCSRAYVDKYEGKNATFETVKLAIDAGADLNAFDAYYCTPLMHVITMENQEDAAKLLIEKGAKVNVSPDYEASSRWVYLLRLEAKNMIKLLLMKGAQLPDEMFEDSQKQLDEIIKEINSEIDQENDSQNILMLEKSDISMPVYDVVRTLHRLPIASEVHKQRKEEEAAKAMQRVG